MQVELVQLSQVAGIAVVVAGVLVLALRAKLAASFAEAGALESLATRVKLLEARVAQMPGDEERREVVRRLVATEVFVGEARSALLGLTEGQKRIEHVLSMLVENELRGRATNEHR